MSLLNYQDYLVEVYGNGDKTKSLQYSILMNEAKANSETMSMDEANEILENLSLPDNIREYIERESRGVYSFEPKVSEGKTHLINFIPMIDTSLNENDSWVNLNEEDKHKMETVLWEAIYDYITADVVNEGLFSFIARGFTALVDGGAKAIKAGWALITGIGKLLKSAIMACVEGAKKLFKWGVGYGKSLAAKAEAQAEERFKRLRQHGEEQMQQDMNDFSETVAWFTGKAPEESLTKSEGDAAGVAQTAVDASEEERGKAEEVLKKATVEVKKKAANENRKNTKQATLALEEIQKLSFNECYDFYATAVLIGLTEGKETLNESEQFDFVLSHPLDERLKNKITSFTSVNEGLWDKVTSFFGFGDDEEEDKDAEQTDMMKAKEDELNQKDAEQLKNAKMPPTPEGNPENKAEEKAAEAEEQAQGDGWGIGKAIKAVIRVLLQGPVFLVEWVAENGISQGAKMWSACSKKLGGPGVFLLITIAAGIAILIGLSIEIIVASGIVGEHSTFAKFFHLGALGSTLHWIEHIAEHVALAAAKNVAPIIKWIPVAISIVMAFKHLKHVLHDAKLGKNIDHSKAIEKLGAETKKIDDELEKTDDEELKKLLAEKQDIIMKQVKFHKQMRELKVEVVDLDKTIAEEKELMKDHKSKTDEGDSDKIDELEGLMKKADEAKNLLSNYDDAIAKWQKSGDTKQEERAKEMKAKAQKEYDDIVKTIKDKEAEMDKEGDANGDAKSAMVKLKSIREKEHELHEKEHQMKHKFDSYYKDGGPKSEIKELNDKIQKLKSGKNESVMKSYKDFVNEAEINEYDSIMDSLKNSFINERPNLRRKKIDEENNEWIKNNFSFEMDEEFDSFVDGSWFNNQKVSENNVNEHWIHFGPTLKNIWNNIKRKYSGFQTGLVGTWDDWNYLEELPKEVATAAKELKVNTDKINYFDDVDNPDAYAYLLKELKNAKVKYVEGEYTNSMDNKVKFVLVVE